MKASSVNKSKQQKNKHKNKNNYERNGEYPRAQ